MLEPVTEFKIENKRISENSPVYFIADIAANHDGDIVRAKELIHMAKEAGADAAKFQHFRAEKIVSDYGFKSLGNQKSHQSIWKKSVFEVFKDASVSSQWTQELKDTCNKVGITFFTSPYDFELVDHIDPYVPAYKIGSGDITWIEMIEYLSVAMIMYIRGDLLQKQAHHALQRLMKCVCCLSSPIKPSFIFFIQVSTGRICQHIC